MVAATSWIFSPRSRAALRSRLKAWSVLIPRARARTPFACSMTILDCRAVSSWATRSSRNAFESCRRSFEGRSSVYWRSSKWIEIESTCSLSSQLPSVSNSLSSNPASLPSWTSTCQAPPCWTRSVLYSVRLRLSDSACAREEFSMRRVVPSMTCLLSRLETRVESQRGGAGRLADGSRSTKSGSERHCSPRPYQQYARAHTHMHNGRPWLGLGLEPPQRSRKEEARAADRTEERCPCVYTTHDPRSCLQYGEVLLTDV